MKARQSAQRLLTYYLRTVWEKSGIPWGPDNDIEVESIVDAILNDAESYTDEAVERAEERAEPEDNRPPLAKRDRS